MIFRAISGSISRMHMHFTFVRAGLIRFASYTETVFPKTFLVESVGSRRIISYNI